MEKSNKTLITTSVVSLAIGSAATYFFLPTKIETRVEFKEKIIEVEKMQKTADKTVVVKRKTTNPNGSITETEVIRNNVKNTLQSKEASKETSKKEEKIVTNPKNLSLGVVYKANLSEIPNIDFTGQSYYKNLGVQVNYDTGWLNTYITGSVFIDSTIIIGVGIKL
jgi:hypothetical protein